MSAQGLVQGLTRLHLPFSSHELDEFESTPSEAINRIKQNKSLSNYLR